MVPTWHAINSLIRNLTKFCRLNAVTFPKYICQKNALMPTILGGFTYVKKNGGNPSFAP